MPNASKEILYHAMFLAKHLPSADLHDGLVYILCELDIPPHNIGYYYAKAAIVLFCENPLHTLLKGIYQRLSEQLDQSVSCAQIEQAIRWAVGYAYCHRDSQVWRCYFKTWGKQKCPSNYEFISQIACFVELWQACCKEVSYEIG